MPFRSPFANRFFDRWQDQACASAVAAQLHLPLRTVQRLFARFEQLGRDGIATRYAACGQQQPAQTPPEQVEQLCQTRRDHPLWGSEMIRLELATPQAALPCARTVRRHLRRAGLQAAPPGRPPTRSPRLGRARTVHQRWQIDASEELRLADGSRVCWLRVVDECSGAFLQTVVFAFGRWEHVPRQAIQAALRRAFRVWGLPQEIRVDNGYPWGNSSDFPPELALWLIGLGIGVVWIPPGCPQQNGVVERAQDVGQDWCEPQTCASAAELQQRCDVLDRRQREQYPYRDGQSRWQVYPALRHSGRPYRVRGEAQQWDVQRVWNALAQEVGQRQVDRTACVSIYNRNHYVGKAFIGTTVYVTLDPLGPTWVIADAQGRQLRTHPAEELSAQRIRSLSVTCRKGKGARTPPGGAEG